MNEQSPEHLLIETMQVLVFLAEALLVVLIRVLLFALHKKEDYG